MKVDAQRPSTWVPYRKGLCEGCRGLCCSLPVEATLEDLVRLGLTSAEEIELLSAKQIARKLIDQRIVRLYSPKSPVPFLLAQQASGACIYQNPKTGLCTVYEKRPEVCREFPTVGPKPGWCPASKL